VAPPSSVNEFCLLLPEFVSTILKGPSK